jgi:hypothetical protein
MGQGKAKQADRCDQVSGGQVFGRTQCAVRSPESGMLSGILICYLVCYLRTVCEALQRVTETSD